MDKRTTRAGSSAAQATRIKPGIAAQAGEPTDPAAALGAARQLLALLQTIREAPHRPAFLRLLTNPEIESATQLLHQAVKLSRRIEPLLGVVQEAVDQIRPSTAHGWVVEKTWQTLGLLRHGLVIYESLEPAEGAAWAITVDEFEAIAEGRLPLGPHRTFVVGQIAALETALAMPPKIPLEHWAQVADELEQEFRLLPKHGLRTPQMRGDDGNSCDYVTLQQAASIVNKSKSMLEKLHQAGKLPPPDVAGGKGKAHEWQWARLRPALESLMERKLPEIFPGKRLK